MERHNEPCSSSLCLYASRRERERALVVVVGPSKEASKHTTQQSISLTLIMSCMHAGQATPAPPFCHTYTPPQASPTLHPTRPFKQLVVVYPGLLEGAACLATCAFLPSSPPHPSPPPPPPDLTATPSQSQHYTLHRVVPPSCNQTRTSTMVRLPLSLSPRPSLPPSLHLITPPLPSSLPPSLHAIYA